MADPTSEFAAREETGAGKVFCVGLNKTGTTSLEAALESLGYRMGDQRRGEHLLRDWLRRDFLPIIRFARTADAFQDIPFSLPFTFQALAMAYPRARFILTIRDSAEQWYRSVVQFTAEMTGQGRLPTIAEMQADPYAYRGFMYDAQVGTVPGTEDDPFDRKAHLRFYEAHLYAVTAYFRGSDRLLVLNCAEPDSYQRLAAFLGRTPVLDRMPHLNRSKPLPGVSAA